MKGRSIKNGDMVSLLDHAELRLTSMKGRSIKNGDYLPRKGGERLTKPQ